MTKIDLHTRTIGVNFNNLGGADVVLWAPLVETVDLLVLKTEKRIALTKNEFGYYYTKTNEIKPNDPYKFVVNKEKDLPDPASLSQPDGVHGPSQALDLSAFVWSDDDWKNIPLEEYIIYELHTGSFTTEGSLTAIIDKLDYLKDLGITAIELMPVAQFPGQYNWGYDGVFPFAVQHSYGGASALQQLVNACHKKGLAVVLDVVYNHLGPEGNYFAEFAPYFTARYNTPWGAAINFDDAYCDAVRYYFIENALMWFRDFHIDALRLDAVHAIKDLSPKHILKEIREYVNDLVKETGKKHYVVVESDLNDPRFINPIEEGGYGMDAQWVDEFHHALRVTAGGGQQGYYEDFKGINHLTKSYRDAYVYDGLYSPHRKKTFGSKASKNKGKQFVVFSQNHDHVGNRMLGERTSQLVSFEMQKLLAAAVLTSPYLPLLFMGEEWSEPNPFFYFVDHSDVDLVMAVKEGRQREFAAFYSQGEAPDPTGEKTFLKSKLQWQLPEQEPHKTILLFYRQLISLRKNQPALKFLNREQVEVDCIEPRKILFLHRWHKEQHIYCLMNFSKKEQAIKTTKEKNLTVLLNSASSEWSVPSGKNEDSIKPYDGSPLRIRPESIIIYALDHFGLMPADLNSLFSINH